MIKKLQPNRAICRGDDKLFGGGQFITRKKTKEIVASKSFAHWKDATLERVRKEGRGSIEFQRALINEMYFRGLLKK